MNTRLVLASLAAPLALALSSCGGSGPSYSYENVPVTIAPIITTIPVNGTQTFTTATQNAPNYPDWFLQPNNPGAPNGSIAFRAGQSSAVYTAPATPPHYTADQVAAGAVQGKVTILMFVPNSKSNVLSDASATETFIITAPAIATGISPATATVVLGASQQFTGYAVGSTNGTLTWQVNGVAGGSTASGTISTGGLYTAPSAIPMAGPTVTVAAVSVADPTRSSAATVTIQEPTLQ